MECSNPATMCSWMYMMAENMIADTEKQAAISGLSRVCRSKIRFDASASHRQQSMTTKKPMTSFSLLWEVLLHSSRKPGRKKNCTADCGCYVCSFYAKVDLLDSRWTSLNVGLGRPNPQSGQQPPHHTRGNETSIEPRNARNTHLVESFCHCSPDFFA